MQTQKKKVEETIAKKLHREKAHATVVKASQKTQEGVVKSLSTLKLTLTSSLDSISNQLSTEIENLKEVQAAIAFEHENLKNLHDITAEADTLQQLRLTQTEAKALFMQDMQALRDGWKTEQAEQSTQRKREQEQWDYDLKKTRKLEQDKYTDQRAQDELNFQSTLNARMEAVAEKQKMFSAMETELASLRAQVVKFDETLKSEASKAVAIATNSLKKDLTNEHSLKELTLQNQLALKGNELTNATHRIQELMKSNTELDEKYKQASDKVQQIAEKAIEGASKQAVVFNAGSSDSTEGRRK